MGIYSQVAYGSNLDDDICEHFGVKDKNKGANSSYETFAFNVSILLDIEECNLISVDPDGRGCHTVYYAIEKHLQSIDEVTEQYNNAIKNLDSEFDLILKEIDSIIADDPEMEEEICYMMFDSDNIGQAKERILELKEIIRKQYPDVISIQTHG